MYLLRRFFSHIMRKPAFCIWEIKGSDQLCDKVQLIRAFVSTK